MDFLFELAWKNIAVASVLALAAAVASRLFRRPALAHGLWFLVLLKLVTPPLWQVPVPWLATAVPEQDSSKEVGNFEQTLEGDYAAAMAAAAIILVDAKPADTMVAPQDGTSPADANVPPDARGASGPLTSGPMLKVASGPVMRITWQQAVLATWALGSSAWLALLLVRLRRFRRLAALAIPASETECRRVSELADSIGLRRPPTMRLLAARVPPMTWGFGGRYELIVPTELWKSLSFEQRDALVLHELAHLRRGDHWVRHFELLVFVLHWWHPLSWWARHELQEAEEECCDALVVRTLPHSAGDYADLIVETVAYLSQRPSPALPPLASGLGQIQHVRKRLAAILKGPGTPRLSLWSWLGLAVVGCGLLPLLPSFAKEPATSRNSVPSSVDTSDRTLSKELGASGKSASAAGDFEFLTEELVEPTEENLAILRLQLVQKEADFAEEKLLLERATKRAQRQTALTSTGAAGLELLEQCLTDQQVHEARLRGREAGVQELQLLVKQEESRLEKARKNRGFPPTDALARLESNSTVGAEPEQKPLQPKTPAVERRLSQMETRLDRLFAEAMALKAELEHERTQKK